MTEAELKLLGSIGGAGIAGLTGYAAQQTGKDALRALGEQMSPVYQGIQENVNTAAEFKPYTVTGANGGATYGAGTLDLGQNVAQQGFLGQAQAMQQGMSQGVQGLGGLGDNAFSQAQQAMGAQSGAYMAAEGGLYGTMGQNQIANAQSSGMSIPQSMSLLRS